MIKGKAKMEFGVGDIRMTACLNGDVGVLCCDTQRPHGIGEKVPVEDGWNVDQSEVIMTFSRPESIDALIAELTDAKDMMLGNYKGELNKRDGLMDLDAFLD